MENVLAASSESRGSVWHDTFALGGANLAAEIGFAGFAEFTLFTLRRTMKRKRVLITSVWKKGGKRSEKSRQQKIKGTH